MIQLANIFNY